MTTHRIRFSVGQPVHHKLFDYRGVIVDVDAVFSGTDEWYEEVARSRPPREEPWYHVLVGDAVHQTYVAEQNLEPDLTGKRLSHPDLKVYFRGFEDGLYVSRKPMN